MAKGFYTIVLLIVSNLFMTFAWYGHLQFQKIDWLKSTGLIGIIAISWFIALFEYIFQVPANRIGHAAHGGPFSLFELKTMQEAISIFSIRDCEYLCFQRRKPSMEPFIGVCLDCAGRVCYF